MSTENPDELPPNVEPATLAVTPGSASEVFIAELTGKPIRKLHRERLLVTGDRLCNKYGQELWTLEAFHPKGARVTQWPLGNVADYTWEQLYGFYERLPDTWQNDASQTAAPKTET